MTRPLIILGGGEHARSVAWAAQSAGFFVVGFLDPNAIARTVALVGAPHLGGDEKLAELVDEHEFVLGIGTIGVHSVRRTVASRVAGIRFASVVHATAAVAPSATIGPGAVVLAGAIVGPGAKIGEHAVVNTGAIVEHDCEIGDYAQLAPGVVLGGGCKVGDDAFVGLGARVRDHVRIGSRAMVAMGAVVVADVRDDGVVIGVPAREKSHA